MNGSRVELMSTDYLSPDAAGGASLGPSDVRHGDPEHIGTRSTRPRRFTPRRDRGMHDARSGAPSSRQPFGDLPACRYRETSVPSRHTATRHGATRTGSLACALL